ncbi:hypothetical protein QBC38DRAFT_444106 [Podospora fimiseda]|uniref:CsbD-like domain-containing protein n=1 Tax=Podospora fimiseda TaxID=252190 RepID=A0AAN7BPC6_9PEZI|nr:hypothetical protein QBC38DRAFT_444106 [Podospora fimiseda]
MHQNPPAANKSKENAAQQPPTKSSTPSKIPIAKPLNPHIHDPPPSDPTSSSLPPHHPTSSTLRDRSEPTQQTHGSTPTPGTVVATGTNTVQHYRQSDPFDTFKPNPPKPGKEIVEDQEPIRRERLTGERDSDSDTRKVEDKAGDEEKKQDGSGWKKNVDMVIGKVKNEAGKVKKEVGRAKDGLKGYVEQLKGKGK